MKNRQMKPTKTIWFMDLDERKRIGAAYEGDQTTVAYSESLQQQILTQETPRQMVKEDRPTSTLMTRSKGYKIIEEQSIALSNTVLNSQISHADRVTVDLIAERGSRPLLDDNEKEESRGTTMIDDTSKLLLVGSIGPETQAG